MPSIPNYNQGATEEAGLTRAKRRVIGFMEQGSLKLTERPAVDLTNGQAEVLAEDSVKQMEEITSTLRQGNIYFEALSKEDEDDDPVFVVDRYTDAKKILKFVIIARKLALRLIRDLKRLLKGNSISYIALGTFADLQTSWDELGEILETTTRYLVNIDIEIDAKLEEELNTEMETLDKIERERDSDDDDDEEEEELRDTVSGLQRRIKTTRNFSKISGFSGLVDLLLASFKEIQMIMGKLKSNFNQARQQRVSAPEEIPDEKSGGRFRKPLYRIGNNVMGAMYELDGLPRFI